MISLKFKNIYVLIRNFVAIILIFFFIYFGLKKSLNIIFYLKTIDLSICLKVTTNFYFNKLYYLGIKVIKTFLFFIVMMII